MAEFIAWIGQHAINFTTVVGKIALLFLAIIVQTFKILFKPKLIIKAIYDFGVSSAMIIIFCGIFIGLVMGLQAYNSLILFNAESSLGALVGISILREIGPVFAAILFASSAGSAMTSEIGLMKATDQLNALEVMAINPVARILGPRFWAGIISMPILAMMFNACAILGTYLMAVGFYQLDKNVFWGQMQASISVSYDVYGAVLKSISFGLLVSLIAVYNGFNSFPTPGGILKATNRTVVWCAMSILAVDFMLTVFLFTG